MYISKLTASTGVKFKANKMLWVPPYSMEPPREIPQDALEKKIRHSHSNTNHPNRLV